MLQTSSSKDCEKAKEPRLISEQCSKITNQGVNSNKERQLSRDESLKSKIKPQEDNYQVESRIQYGGKSPS